MLIRNEKVYAKDIKGCARYLKKKLKDKKDEHKHSKIWDTVYVCVMPQ